MSLPVFECGLVARAAVAARLADLPALRERPGTPASRPIPPRFLRYADEQTVVGLAAVMRAMDDPALCGAKFDSWGVLAASRFPGRLACAGAFVRFARDGAATVSPHIIPQNSLHSLAGAISVALGLHGPNFGVGGGPEALGEGLTAALTLLDTGLSAGVWLVLSGWDPEPVPDGAGSSTSDAVCHGLALALVPGPGAECGTLRLIPEPLGAAQRGPDGSPRSLDVAQLAAALDAQDHACAQDWVGRLPWGARLEMRAATHRHRKAA